MCGVVLCVVWCGVVWFCCVVECCVVLCGFVMWCCVVLCGVRWGIWRQNYCTGEQLNRVYWGVWTG